MLSVSVKPERKRTEIVMNNTAKLPLLQACDAMMAAAQMHARIFLGSYNEIPATRRDEICRLGQAMWDELSALDKDVRAVEAKLNDPAFIAFKASLLKRPRRQRKAKGVTA